MQMTLFMSIALASYERTTTLVTVPQGALNMVKDLSLMFFMVGIGLSAGGRYLSDNPSWTCKVIGIVVVSVLAVFFANGFQNCLYC